MQRAVLLELIRVDLRHRWSRPGLGKRVEQYRTEFDLPTVPLSLVHDEYRLRRAAGEPVELADYLRERGVTRVFLCGVAPDYCVGWSAIDARAAGFGSAEGYAAARERELEAALAAGGGEGENAEFEALLARLGKRVLRPGDDGAREDRGHEVRGGGAERGRDDTADGGECGPRAHGGGSQPPARTDGALRRARRMALP